MRCTLARIAWMGLLLFLATIPCAEANIVYTWTGVCEATPIDPFGRVVYCYPGSLVTMRVVLSDDYVPGTTVTSSGGPPPIFPFEPPPPILSWTIDIIGSRFDVLRRDPFVYYYVINLTLPVSSGPGSAFLQGTTSGTIDATGWNLNVVVSSGGTQLCCLAGHGSVGRWERLIPVATVVTVVASPNPATAGKPVTLTATVSGANPTGSVQFLDRATRIGPAVALGSGGAATLTIASLPQGFHAITASYSGDDANAASSSVALALEVDAPPVLITPVPGLSLPALVALSALIAALGLRLRRSPEHTFDTTQASSWNPAFITASGDRWPLCGSVFFGSGFAVALA